MVGAAKGYRVKLTMPACVSLERRRVLEALGADLVLTPSELGTDGAIIKAREIYAEDQGEYFMPDQFRNQENILAHYFGTGREILEQTGGEIDAFVAGLGTTGTLMGVGRRLKEYRQSIAIVGAEPTEGHTIQGLKNMKESIVPRIYYPEQLDEKITVEDGEAFEIARLLARAEGIFAGMSSGAAMAGALRIAGGITSGTIVVLLPDRGDRYLSTTLYRSICAKCPP
jgi:cysteine synthase B